MSKESDIEEIKYDISNIKWHEVGNTNEPVFLNNWVNFDIVNHHGAGFRRVVNGGIELRGRIKSGSINDDAFMLPIGYRPTKQIIVGIISNSAFGRVDIASNGNVSIQSPSSNVWVSLDGIVFNTG